MKAVIKRLAATMLLLSGQVAVSEAQVIYNTGGQEMLNTMMNNTMNTIRTKDLSDPMTMGARQQAGATKIKAGKATLRFASSPEATRTLAQSLKWSADEPQELTGQVNYIQRYVKMFSKLMMQNNFTPNDFTDGYVFAYALSYAAANNRDLGKAELDQMRDEDRAAGLKNAYFQGMSDAQKQVQYEFMAIMAMQAVEQRAKYRRATTEKERSEYDATAKHYAEYLLQSTRTN